MSNVALKILMLLASYKSSKTCLILLADKKNGIAKHLVIPVLDSI